MVNLSQYFDEQKWIDFHNLIVPKELKKNTFFFNYLNNINVFPNDINEVLASLYENMFFGKIEFFEKWMKNKHKMLDNNTPMEILKSEEGEKTLKEYIMRYPSI